MRTLIIGLIAVIGSMSLTANAEDSDDIITIPMEVITPVQPTFIGNCTVEVVTKGIMGMQHTEISNNVRRLEFGALGLALHTDSKVKVYNSSNLVSFTKDGKC